MGFLFLVNLLALVAFQQSAQAVTIKSITVAPAVLSVTSIALTNGNHASNVSTSWTHIYTTNDVVTATVKYSGAVTVTGSPTLSLNIGGTTRSATYVSGSGTTELTFTYTIENQLADTDGISIDANALSLSGGAINDASTHAAILTHSAVADNGDYQVLTIGGSYEGGKIAYFLASVDNPLGTISGDNVGVPIPYSALAPHGLIAQTADISSVIPWATSDYDRQDVQGIENQPSYSPTASGIRFGDGAANTVAIYQQHLPATTGYAAGIVMNSGAGGKSDWYLPSAEELKKLWINRSVVGGFADNYYWSSSEYDAYLAWYQLFSNGIQYFSYKFFNFRVRAVRAF